MKYEKKHDKVIILGTASSLNDVDWTAKADFWACSPVITHAPAFQKKMDLLFEMHDSTYWHTIKDRLNAYDAPVYMLKKNNFIQRCIEYPLKEIQEQASNDRMRKYFTNTISYMIALACLLQYKIIRLMGVHMSADEEYDWQRQSCESWLGFAEGRGIQVEIAPQSEIFKNYCLYGYETEHDMIVQCRHRRDGLKRGLEELKKRLEKTKEDYDIQIGSIKDCEHWLKYYK